MVRAKADIQNYAEDHCTKGVGSDEVILWCLKKLLRHLFKIIFLKKIYLFCGGGVEGEGEISPSRLHTERGSPHGAQPHDPEIMT